MIHMSIDNDEKMENSCNKCKTNMEKKSCQICGTELMEEYSNPSFDEELFEKLKNQAT